MRTMRCLLMGLAVALVSSAQTVAFKWVETKRFAGQGICQTAPFKLQSDEWRIGYKPHGNTPFQVVLCDVVTGARTLIAKQVRQGSAMDGHRKGEMAKELAYLTVNTPSANWQLDVEQYLDLPGEWYLRKWQSPAARLMPFGSWAGEPGEKKWSVEVKDPVGRFVCRQNAPGRVALTVATESGELIGNMVSVKPGTLETWFYHPGIYTLTVSAIASGWNLTVESTAK